MKKDPSGSFYFLYMKHIGESIMESIIGRKGNTFELNKSGLQNGDLVLLSGLDAGSYWYVLKDENLINRFISGQPVPDGYLIHYGRIGPGSVIALSLYGDDLRYLRYVDNRERDIIEVRRPNKLIKIRNTEDLGCGVLTELAGKSRILMKR